MSHVSGHTDGTPDWLWDYNQAQAGGAEQTPQEKAAEQAAFEAALEQERQQAGLTGGQESRDNINGLQVYGPGGQLYTATRFPPWVGDPVLRGPDGQMHPLQAGTYVTSTGDLLRVNQRGQINSSRKLSVQEFQQAREGFGAGLPGSGTGGGGGGGGRGGGGGGGVMPDPYAAIRVIHDAYRTAIEQGDMNFQQALQEFNAQTGLLATEFAQQFDVASAFEDASRQREIAGMQRGMGIQQERGQRARDLQGMMRASLPAGTQLPSVPMLGQVPAHNVNPDQFFDIAGLNAIPQVSPTPAATFPEPNIHGGMQVPQAPGPVQIPDVLSLLAQMGMGF